MLTKAWPPAPSIDENTFLLWEPCSKSHGEIIPGYTKYLLELGFRVAVLMTPARISEGLFSRMDHPNLHLSRLSQKRIRRFLKTQPLQNAAGVLITTAGKLPRAKDGTPDLISVFGGKIPNNVHLVEHDVATQITSDGWNPDTITLRALDPALGASRVVNPHYFGDVTRAPKNQSKTVFTLVGAARSKRRNDNLVLNAAQRLIETGITNFEIRLVGKKGTLTIPPVLEPYIKELGRLDFDAMFDEIEQADFLLTAFQKDNSDHAFYRTTGTTGSFQLAYGFGKPCILQEGFAIGSVLSSQNSLLYDNDEHMYDAMRTAIEMSADDYTALQSRLLDDANGLANASLENLKELINGQ